MSEKNTERPFKAQVSNGLFFCYFISCPTGFVIALGLGEISKSSNAIVELASNKVPLPIIKKKCKANRVSRF